MAAAAQHLKGEYIDLIIASPVARTQETAQIVHEELGLPVGALRTEERLREMMYGELDGKTIEEWHRFYATDEDTFTKKAPGGETYAEMRRRVGEFLFELERRHTNKNILLVTHDAPAWLLESIAKRLSNSEIKHEARTTSFQPAEVRRILFAPFPHNANYELDLHRPYIDQIVLVEGGKEYERTPEVIDCWVESGAMPFASANYPRDKSVVDPAGFFGFGVKGYPADFIAEYIAQTRTWFYYMHAMGVLLFNKIAFKNVVSTGTILAADGSKMSKSKGNYTDPYELMEQYGADALRFSLMSSVVMQGEDLNFRDEDVREMHNRVLQMLWNSFKFFELYKGEYDGTAAVQSPHALDRWLRSRLDQTTAEATLAMDAYDLPRACRALRAIVDDYSTWYLRRSRERTKGADRQYALANQCEAFLIMAKLFAPIAPFIAEAVYQGLGEKGSVHLSNWPQGGAVDEELLRTMEKTRELASAALKLRERAGIKIRQPLGHLTIKRALPQELQEILAQELNVKEVAVDETQKESVVLDTTITPELKEEGTLREWVRAIQDWRKEQKLAVSDRPGLLVQTPEAEFIRRHREVLMEMTGLMSLETREGELKLEKL